MVGERADIEVGSFIWEFEAGGNVAHLARHNVRIADVNAVLRFGPIYFRNSERHAAIYAMLGKDGRNRSLIVYLLPTVEGGVWKPITGWRSSLAHKILEQEGRI